MEEFNKAHIRELARKWRAGTITPEERITFDKWYNSRNDEELHLPEGYDEQVAHRLGYASLLEQIGEQHQPAEKLHSWYRRTGSIAAASILLIAGMSIFFYQQFNNKLDQQKILVTQNFNIEAGGNHAILKLASGKEINLNSIKNGETLEVDGSRITKTEEGKISYDIIDQTGVILKNTNTISTPAGGQFALVLPDGTSVKLNALSSLSYPVAFSKDNRKVTLKGEAYFQVAKDKARPFIVNSRQQDVEVLGTQFNINAYDDENKVVTTLEEGSVKVTTAKQSRIIKPAEQTIIGADNSIAVKKANMDETLGWTKGKMVFVEADIRTIMRQVSRWYGIGVRYQGEVNIKPITGKISRDMNLNDFLKLLRSSSINFSMEEQGAEKTLVITP